MAETSDAELLGRYTTAGDRAALDTLVRRHIDFVYAAARRQMRGRADAADDVTQAVFLVLARRAGSVPAGRLGGWLFRTVRYAAANARRAEARRARHERNALTPEPTMPADPHKSLAALDDALASLRAADREAIILRYLQGKDVADVGRHFGTSDGTAQRRIGRAVERLRHALARRGVKTADAAAVAAVVTLAAQATAPAATVAHAAAVATGAASATASATAIGKGTVGAIWAAKAKAAAAIAVSATLATGVGVGVARHYATPAATPATINDPYDGVWTVVRSATQDATGLRLPPSAAVRLSKSGQSVRLSSLDDADRRVFVFGPAGPPQQIDAPSDANPALARRGLIEWRDGDLWLAFGPPGGQRPTGIGSGEASATTPSVLTLRRAAATGGKS